MPAERQKQEHSHFGVPKVIFVTMAPATNKCSFRSCKKVQQSDPDNVVAFRCSAPDCEKFIHLECCKIICKQHGREFPKDTSSLFCTKACSDKLQKAATGTKLVLWSQDGKEGPNDTIGNSERLLIDWIISGENYANYLGPKNGATKRTIATGISEMFKRKGVKVERSAKSIEAKISSIEQSFKKAYEWTQNTGVGVKEDDPESFAKHVLKLCAYFHDLEKVMTRRSKVRPLCTSDNLIGILSSDDEDDDLDDISTSGTTTTTDLTTTDSEGKQKEKKLLSLVKKRAAGAKKTTGGNKKRRTASDFDFGDSHLAHILEMKQKELELKKEDQNLAKQEAEQKLKMQTIENVQRLKSPPYNWSNEQIKKALGPICEPILDVF